MIDVSCVPRASRAADRAANRRALVEIAGGLVGQEQRRAHDQRPRDGDTLLLAA